MIILLERKELLLCMASEFLQSQAVGEPDISPSVSHKNPLQELSLVWEAYSIILSKNPRLSWCFLTIFIIKPEWD